MIAILIYRLYCQRKSGMTTLHFIFIVTRAIPGWYAVNALHRGNVIQAGLKEEKKKYFV